MACGDRPPAVERLAGAPGEGALGQRRERKAEPRSDEDLRWNGPDDVRVRKPRQRCEAAGDQDRPGSGARPERAQKPGDARGRDRRQRHDRHDEPGRERLEAPAVDEQDHEQEQRRHERARDEQERGVGRDLRSLSRFRHGPRRHTSEREQADERERRLQHEDRLPAEELRENSSERRPHRRADDPGERPDPSRRGVRARGLGEQIECGDDDRGARDTLDSAQRHEHAERRRERTRQRGNREEDRRHTEDPDRPPPRHGSRRNRSERQRQVERDQRPGERPNLDVELHEDLRQRERDHGRVGQDEPDRESEQGDPVPRSERLHSRTDSRLTQRAGPGRCETVSASSSRVTASARRRLRWRVNTSGISSLCGR